MLKLTELLDTHTLDAMVNSGMVRVQKHFSLPFYIYNYTAQAQYSRTWNDVTEQCRGLIVDEDGYVLARPFRKFYNYGEWEGKTLPSGPIEVTDKADGSLGILYQTPDGPGDRSEYAIATRGSFTSEQATWATTWLNETYPDFDPEHGVTHLFEIVYPENRIVLDYAGWSGLILLARVEIATGRTLDGVGTWPGRVIETYPYDSIDQVLAAPQEPNREGFVIRFKDSDTRIKFKFDEYVRLHRIVTGVSSKTIWELLSQNKPLDELINNVPDEFYNWVESTASEIESQYRELTETVLETYALTLVSAQRDAEYEVAPRRVFASYATKTPFSAPLFSLLDQRDISEWVWKQVQPTYATPNMISEDTA